ncbi:Zinc knuckle CX2CX4HX4C [Sesbania bispinosa]|nr:Zinc knuckle CX2CX4HX4C [Sesbania bispinosa]
MSQRREQPLIVFTEEDVSDGVSRCLKSLVCKIISKKPVHTNSLQNALSGIWCSPSGFKVEELGTKLFQFFFDKESDMDRILRGNPWIFRNSWLCLQRWERNSDPESLCFSKVPLKVQISGLTAHCRPAHMGRRIGACLGEVKESDIFESKERGSFIKIPVEFDISKPLRPGVNVGSQEDGVMWVDFQYERLPQFCYPCGLIGHEEDFCGAHPDKSTRDNQKESDLGPWLRAYIVGRKLIDQ